MSELLTLKQRVTALRLALGYLAEHPDQASRETLLELYAAACEISTALE
jgi:hypothetical protein